MRDKNLTIKIPEDLHIKIKVRASSKGKSIKDYLISLVEKEMENGGEKLEKE